ncbi:MAG TPA: universal stress protein, partial [Gemmatimonadaceae bacterium]
MSSTLLLPLDGSEKDRWAVVFGAMFAALTRSNVLIVRVIHPAIDDRHRHFVGRCLRKAVDRLADARGLPVSYEVAEGADVANVLLRMAEEQDVQLVVMATRAATGLDRALR